MLTKRMAMRRMNEMCRRMALTLLFYVLLFHTCQGQSDTTVAPTAPQTSATVEPASTLNSSEASSDPSTTISSATDADQGDDHLNNTTPNTFSVSTNEQALTSLDTVKAINPISEEDPTVDEALENITDETMQKEQQNNMQDLQDTEHGPDTVSSTQAPVFVPVLVSGLILAAGLVGLYAWKNHCRTKSSGMKLAEESYMADEENQGNTLVSVAPLNPPENQEKPSQNGESLEAVKTQNPPTATNGHSTAKADTEL